MLFAKEGTGLSGGFGTDIDEKDRGSDDEGVTSEALAV